jgi:hypothetical protein
MYQSTKPYKSSVITVCLAYQSHHESAASFFENHIFSGQKKNGMAKGSSVSPIVINIYMEHFQKLAFLSAQHIPSL